MFDTSCFDRTFGCGAGHITGSFACGSKVTSADAATGANPFVGCIDDFGHVIVGHNVGWCVRAGADDRD